MSKVWTSGDIVPKSLVDDRPAFIAYLETRYQEAKNVAGAQGITLPDTYTLTKDPLILFRNWSERGDELISKRHARGHNSREPVTAYRIWMEW